MSVTGVFTKGRPSGHASATSILKYIPRARVPWQPSRFGRENLDESDLARLWSKGRYRNAGGNYNSGYSTEKTHVMEDHTVSIIPKHDLEKFMPDIALGPKALVTPVSLMSARNGHRVTHDLLHSYDAYIGRLQKPAVVDHDNITVEDPNRVGLNAATLDCRGRIYRWLRRGPFFQEDHYFRRSVKLARDGTVPVAVHEGPLMAKIVRLARRGHLKAACEEYRRVTSIPPVAVYRALTAACIPGAKLADAIAVFEDGNARLFYVARDGEVLCNLMRCAIKAKHRVRVVWVYNTMRGRYYENCVVRAEVDPIWQYRIAALALEFLLDTNAGEEARAVYQFLAGEKLLDGDVHARLGQLMQEALKEGKTIQLTEQTVRGMAVVRNAEAMAPHVAHALCQRYAAQLDMEVTATGPSSLWTKRSALPDLSHTATPAEATAWLQTYFPDIDVMAVLRLARFRYHVKDLMANDQQAYVQRAAAWVETLSSVHAVREEAPLPYLRKTRPSITNEKIRVAWLPERRRATDLLANEEGYTFAYNPQMRVVEETVAYVDNTLQAHFLAQHPLHHEVPAAVPLHVQTAEEGPAAIPRYGTRPARILHKSVVAASAALSDGRGVATAPATAVSSREGPDF